MEVGPCVRTELSGWGRYPQSVSCLYRPEKIGQAAGLIGAHKDSSLIARGLGRSYGDAATNSDNGVILTTRLNRFLCFDPEDGTLTCESGTSLEEILDAMVKRGWFLPVTPGTKYVTVGGSIACDVHGKNHHLEGSFVDHLQSFRLLRANGSNLLCSRDENQDAFWASVGGMGLTGLITEATFRMRPIGSAYLAVDYQSTSGLDETLGLLEEEDQGYTYSVAWVDCLARGKATGRAVLMQGNHAQLEELDSRKARRPFCIAIPRQHTVPLDLPGFVLNRFSVSQFNALYHRRFRSKSRELVDFDRFFYPLDALRQWNRLYGKSGFLQYQFVLPHEPEHVGLQKIFERLSRSRYPSFLAVLKRFGPGKGLLSFPMPGYTLALDIPLKNTAVLEFLEELDRIVLEHGGRVYLAKDARLSADHFPLMYPSYPKWMEIKGRLDPEGRFSSDLSRRLKMGA